MGAANYVVLDVPLTAVADKRPVDGQNGFKGSLVDFVQLLSIPAGAVMSLHYGASSDPIPVDPTTWSGTEFQEGHDAGVFFSVPTVQAGSCKILVSFGGCP